MSQAETIRDAFVMALQPLLTTNGGPIGQILPFAVSNPSPPVVYVTDGETDYDQAMGRGLDKLSFVVVAILPFGGPDVSAQQQVDNLRDPSGATSIKTLIETLRTTYALQVTKVSRTQTYQAQGQPVGVGCEWTVDVYA